MREGKLNKRREGKAIKNLGERLWSDRDNIRNRSVSTDSPSVSVTSFLLSLQAVAVMLSDQTTAHLRLFSSISPLALLASFTCSFFKCILFFLGFPIALFLPVALEHQRLPHELWISKRLYPGILPTPAQPLLPLSLALCYWSSHTRSGWIPCPLKCTWEHFQRLTVHPMGWLPLCNLLVSSGALIKKWHPRFIKRYVA